MDESTPSGRLRELITGYEPAQCVYVAAKLRIADALGDGARTAEWLAGALGANAAALRRLMRALASLGLVNEHGDGTFGLTVLGEHLRTDAPGSLRALALLAGERSYRAWGALAHSVITGRPAFEQVYGATTFEYMARHPELAAVYDEAMSASASEMVAGVLESVDLFGFRTLVDVGGGVGQLVVAALRRYPRLEAVLFDRAPVIERARRRISDAGLEERCRLVAGDFFVGVPAGGDVYVLSHVIHNWDDDQSRTILRTCRAAMPEAAMLLVVEKIMPATTDASARVRKASMADLHMLVITGGRERMLGEYDRLLAASGLRRARHVDTQAAESIIEARRLPEDSPRDLPGAPHMTEE